MKWLQEMKIFTSCEASVVGLPSAPEEERVEILLTSIFSNHVRDAALAPIIFPELSRVRSSIGSSERSRTSGTLQLFVVTDN